MVTIQEIIKKAKEYLSHLNEERLKRAYDFAENAHAGQTRFSGEPYIIHPLSVADILLDFHPDEDMLVACFLHDVAEDTSCTIEDIGAAFGVQVKNLCEGMVKLSKVRHKLNDPQTENLRKLFLAMAKDFRVVLLKLCDRLHNMRTLGFVREEKRTRIAQETLNIYAPIAARLGIYKLKSQLEDHCFRHLYPDDYKRIGEQLAKAEKWRDKYIENAKHILIETLSSEGIQSEVEGRIKSMYSIYRKLKKKNKNSVDEIFDVFAMRVVLPDIYKYGREYTGHIYTALGVIHNHFTPLANRFKDYVAVPKVNGYRSLHTTVMGLGSQIHIQPTEIQIRTTNMHASAELGIAAHWLYEENVNLYDDSELSRMIQMPSARPVTFEAAAAVAAASFIKQHKDWLSGLYQIEQETQNNQEFLDNLQVDVFHDRIFVLTPRGDVKDLPAGATPVDFAYTVHTEIGNHCVGARVNGNIVPLDYELKSGEVVEILVRKNAKPSQQWLAFVKTSHTRNRIRAWLRGLDVKKHIREGKNLLNLKLRQLGKPPLDFNLSLLKNYEGRNLTVEQRQELLAEIGRGGVLPSAVLRKLFTLEDLLDSKPARGQSTDISKGAGPAAGKKHGSLIIGGEKNVPYAFVKCCNADFSDKLIGYVTRGRGVSVHKKDCKVINNAGTNRLVKIEAAGSAEALNSYHAQVRIEAADTRIGLIRDISNVIAENRINILDIFQSGGDDEYGEMNLILELNDFDQLDRVLSKLEKIPSVRRAYRVN